MTKPKRRNNRQSWMSKCALSLFTVAGLVSTTIAAQFDAPYYELKKKHGTEWAKEDKAIDTKLAALEEKFGKKPNIIFVLTDDIGWGGAWLAVWRKKTRNTYAGA
jgi:arylsulfatase